jgi:two-component system, NtrC family, response regulator AtoC
MPDILVVDDDPLILPVLKEYLCKKNFTVRVTASLLEARRELARKIPDGLLVDLGLPDGSGIELVEELKNTPTQIIIMTGTPSLETAIAGVRWNAVDYLVKPIELPRLQNWLEGFDAGRPKRQAQPTEEKLFSSGIIGSSPHMQRVNKMIQKVAHTDVTVLLQGESGTGKELVAQAIHQLSLRKDKPLLALNCGAANENLIGDELFGHERGGFTGANKLHKGYFERANGGTLFLDEVTEMPIALQAHLLRVLETGELVRLGGDTVIKTDVRVIAATNRDPHEAIAAGKMREDLYYRLAIFPILLPSLRERGKDIELLVKHFIQQFNDSTKWNKSITQETLDYLQTLTWPGNIRELRNAVQRAHLIAGKEIEISDFDYQLNHYSGQEATSPLSPPSSSIDQAERRMILATLEECQGNKRLAAEALGISLKTIYNKLKKYQLGPG